MKTFDQTTAKQVKTYCAQIGADPLLVQGAGGNVSWKENDVLWVKASGTWLADAVENNIFVPVDLSHLQQAIVKRDFGATPRLIGNSNLRPSIETMLHALLPHRVVVHIHAVEILAHLVKANPLIDLQQLIPDAIQWVLIDYFKPGAELAEAISAHIADHPNINVIFLSNHGVVVGGESTAEIKQIIDSLIQALGSATDKHFHKQEKSFKPKQVDSYVYYQHDDLHALAKNKDYFDYLKTKWALYPDHIVFLGTSPYTYQSHDEFIQIRDQLNALPELIFIYGEGVYVLPHFSQAKTAQLLCYFEVLRRQKSLSQLRPLSDSQVFELTDWEAEKYRNNLQINTRQNS